MQASRKTRLQCRISVGGNFCTVALTRGNVDDWIDQECYG